MFLPAAQCRQLAGGRTAGIVPRGGLQTPGIADTQTVPGPCSGEPGGEDRGSQTPRQDGIAEGLQTPGDGIADSQTVPGRCSGEPRGEDCVMYSRSRARHLDVD